MDSIEIQRRNRPLVSVIIAFYNDGVFLEEAIESVISQDYDNWELLLIDDGSTDAGTGIAKRYAAAHPDKVVYLDHPYHQNRGVSFSRNVGVRHCRGTYVAILDGDDMWLKDKLRSQLELLAANPSATVLLEASLYWNSWRDSTKEDVMIPVGVDEGVYKPPHLALALYPLGKGAAPCPSGIMVHRAVLRRSQFEELFRGEYQVYEDQALLSKIYLKETVCVSAQCHHRYRQRRASLVSDLHELGRYHRVRSYFLYWLKDYLRSQPVRFKAVERLLRRAQLPYRDPFVHKLIVDLPLHFRKLVTRLLVKIRILNYSKSW